MAGTELKQTNAIGRAPVGFRDEREEREWGVGQLIPLLLLALPVFAGWESFWGRFLFLSLGYLLHHIGSSMSIAK
jgi:hypothetical protein